MKNWNYIFFLVFGAITSCNSENPPLEQVEKREDIITEFALAGTWIHHDDFGFGLIDIKDKDNITYFLYSSKREEGREDDWFYKSLAKIDKIDSANIYGKPSVSLDTEKYRFDYILSGDTLIEYDKVGLQLKYVRIK